MQYFGVNFITLRQKVGFRNCCWSTSVAGRPKISIKIFYTEGAHRNSKVVTLGKFIVIYKVK